MLTKRKLEEFNSLKQEQKDLKNRINHINLKRQEVSDSVTGSSSSFPYIEQHCTVTGTENDNTYSRKSKLVKKLKKIYFINEIKIIKELIFIEYELNKIKDSEIRRIIRYRYEDGFNWYKIQIAMNKDTEYAARKQLERFFEKENIK